MSGDSKRKRDKEKSSTSDWDLPERLLPEKRKRVELEPEDNETTVENIEPEKKRAKRTENCRFFPNCEMGDNCPYNHPTKVCNKFPNCPYEDKCLFYHPKPTPPPVMPSVPFMARGFHPTGMIPPCRYGFSCINRLTGCSFSHPLVSNLYYRFEIIMFLIY